MHSNDTFLILAESGQVTVDNNDMAKPGPKPKSGETRTYHTIRTTDDVWNWCKTLGGAGAVLHALYESREGRAWLESFMEGRRDA